MMYVITCKNCGNSSLPFGRPHINLTFIQSDLCCEHCNNTKEDKSDILFCSIKCLSEYLQIEEEKINDLYKNRYHSL